MNAPTSIYAQRPWLKNYVPGLPAELPEPAWANLAQMVSEASRRFGAQTAFTTCMANGMNGSLSFAQVDALSDHFAVYLREELGLAAGARVAVQMPNCLAYPVAVFGILKAGCVLVNTNPLYTAAEMQRQFSDAGAEAVVILDMYVDKLAQVLADTPIRKVVVARLAQWLPPVVRHVVGAILKYWNRLIPPCRISHDSLDAAVARGRQLAAERGINVAGYWRDIGPDTLAVLQYTGGTTGVAKGAMLSHRNLLANAAQVVAMGGDKLVPGKECVLTALPLYHVFAFTVNLLALYQVGARNILVPSPRPIANLQRALENYPVSWITGVNTLFNALLNEEWFNVYPPRHLKASIAGGTALHVAVAERWKRVTQTELVEGYGLTEASPLLTFNPFGGLEKPGSIGVPVPGTQLKLVDAQGAPVPLGEPGELAAQGPQLMQGYWQRPAETAEVLKDGWLYTGDIAVMDADGYFRIVDRKKDVILVSGFNVYPNEVEDVIARLPQVQESAVIGVPDEATGEAVRAYVVLRAAGLTAEEVRAHCKQFLAAYKVPKQVQFRDELPKSPVGKVLRKELRAELNKA